MYALDCYLANLEVVRATLRAPFDTKHSSSVEMLFPVDSYTVIVWLYHQEKN